MNDGVLINRSYLKKWGIYPNYLAQNHPMRTFISIILFFLTASVFSKPILIVTTDIGQDPDDQQSMVRLLHYADKFQLAGIIAMHHGSVDRDMRNWVEEALHEGILKAVVCIASQVSSCMLLKKWPASIAMASRLQIQPSRRTMRTSPAAEVSPGTCLIA